MSSSVGCCSPHHGSSPLFLAALTVACAGCGLGGYFAGTYSHPELSLGLYVVAYVSGGWGPAREVVRSFAQRQIDVNFLMILAALGAASIGQMGEGVALLFLFSLSGTLEKYTLERTARSIESLIKLRPDKATVVRDGVEVRVPLEQVAPGDLVRIVPSERLGIDGVISEGSSSLDESTLTGESIPVEKGVGEEVFAGTLNHRGTLLVKVTRTSNETMLAKIVRMVSEARDEKTGAERHVERWQKPYVIGVLFGAALCTAIPFFFMAHAFRDAFYHGMTFLVAASPCAVVISAPAAVLAGLTRAALKGVLFKGGAYLDRLSTIRAMALDKTGTLTRGEPEIIALFEASGSAEKLNRMLACAASVEKHSEHALGQAVLSEAARRKIPLDGIVQFESHVGLGVHALVNGTWVGVGREQLFESHNLPLPETVAAKAREMRAQGMTALMVVCSDGCAGVLGIADRTRAEAPETIARLRRMGMGSVSVLTGDHAVVGEAIAAQVGADESRSGLRPGEKVTELKRIKDAHGAVAYVGDGVNDAPALAAADIGIAMGGAGTDAALETADVVLMRDDLRGLVFAYWLSQRTRAAIRRGLLIAFGVIAFLVTSTILNILNLTDSFPPLWIAVLCHEGSTVLTIFSGLYLLVESEPAAPEGAPAPDAVRRPAAVAG